MQVGYIKIGDFPRITCHNLKTPTVASVVNLVRSQVYHTERLSLSDKLLTCQGHAASVDISKILHASATVY